MSADHALLQVIIFLAAIAFVVPVARRLNLAPILGYLAAGLAIGPYGFALVQDSHVIHWLAELGVVFLLFAVGLELSLTRLRTIPPAVLEIGRAS
ncbi:MAG: cation:proton antiporter, partial [Alphaproteobacteria bacterium]